MRDFIMERLFWTGWKDDEAFDTCVWRNLALKMVYNGSRKGTRCYILLRNGPWNMKLLARNVILSPSGKNQNEVAGPKGNTRLTMSYADGGLPPEKRARA